MYYGAVLDQGNGYTFSSIFPFSFSFVSLLVIWESFNVLLKLRLAPKAFAIQYISKLIV